MSARKLNIAPIEGGKRGRPRSAECDDAILDATWRLLREQGYLRMSMEGIAQAAGVGKPTLYLRYASKADVVAAAFIRRRLGRAPRPAGDLRADIAAQLEHMRRAMDAVGMSLLGTCLAEEHHVPDLIELLRERSVHPGRQILRDILHDGVRRGLIAPDADIETAIAMGVGSYYALKVGGVAFDEGWADRIAGAMLRLLGATDIDGET